MNTAEPRCIVPMGALATRQVMNRAAKITKMRGQLTTSPVFPGVPILPLLSPNHVLRLPANEELFQSDFKMLDALVKSDFDMDAPALAPEEKNYQWRFDISDVLEAVERGEIITISADVESTGLDWFREEVFPLTVAFSTAEGNAFVCPVHLGYWNHHLPAYNALRAEQGLDPLPEMTRGDVAHIRRQLRKLMANPNVRKVGLNCVDDRTEVLTPEGWVPFPELQDSQEVMQFDPSTEALSFVRPSFLTSRQYSGFLYLWEGMHHSGAYTPDHLMLIRTHSKDNRFETAQQVADRHPNGVRVPCAGTYHDALGIDVPDSWLRLAEAVRADGSLDSGQVRFRIRKPRKVQRLVRLAAEAGVPVYNKTRWCLGKSPARDWIVSLFSGAKAFGPWVLDLSLDQRRVWLDEVKHWDGCVRGHPGSVTWSTAKRVEADWFQIMALTTGYRWNGAERDNNKGFNRRPGAKLYSASLSPAKLNLASHEGPVVRNYVGSVYCVAVPTGAFVIRRDRKVTITGHGRPLRNLSLIALPALDRASGPVSRSVRPIEIGVRKRSRPLPKVPVRERTRPSTGT